MLRRGENPTQFLRSYICLIMFQWPYFRNPGGCQDWGWVRKQETGECGYKGKTWGISGLLKLGYDICILATIVDIKLRWGLPGDLVVKSPSWQCRRHRFDPWSRKIPHAAEQLSLWATTIEPVPWSCNYWSLRTLKPISATREATALGGLCTSVKVCLSVREKPEQQWRPSTAKENE